MIKCPNYALDNLDGSAYCDSCGEALNGAASTGHSAASPATGRIVAGRYQIQRELGGGGQKQMYLAADLRLSNRLCALAELTPAARSPQEVAEGKAMFRREAETLATLSNFHIVQVYDYFDENDRCYLVEEYVHGQTLQQRIASRGRLAVAEINEIATQVLDALEYLHSLTPPLVHRDLKPENIMLAPATGGAEVVKLIDFGIARHFQVQRGTVHGTPGYAAPEQYRGISEPRTDLYALGAILHYALSGRDPQEQPPFSFPPLGSLRPDLPKALCLLVDQALSNDVAGRMPSAVEFKARLHAASTGAKPSPAPQPHPSVPPHPAPPPAPHFPAPLPPQPPTLPLAPMASKIECIPPRVTFRAVERGGGVPPVTVTLRNTGRGTLEARLETDHPELVRVTPDHVGENQAQVQVRVDSSAVIWGHRYRSNVRVVLDHSGDTIAIPVEVEAADNHAVLARVRSLSNLALLLIGTLALGGEILLGNAGITISRRLHGAISAGLSQAADALSIVALLVVLMVFAASRQRGRGATVIVGLVAIMALHTMVAAVLIDYLLLPAAAIALAKANGLILRRPCVRLLGREGLRLGARARALFLLTVPPAALLLSALAWLSSVPAPAPRMAINPWLPPPVPYSPATIVPHHPQRIPRPPTRYRFAAHPPQRVERNVEAIESEARRRLDAYGFGTVSVHVDADGSAYLTGSADDFAQKQEIENAVRGVAGVRSVVSSLEMPRGWMGVRVGSGGGGALVQYVMLPSPAERAGIAVNDVIVGIDGEPIREGADFDRMIRAMAAGQTVTVTLLRHGQNVTVAVKLKKSPFRKG